MPTIITHGLVGLGAGKIYASFTGKKMPPRFWILSAFCPMIPDLDSLGFWAGIPYDHFFGHRGFSHSLSFSLLIGLLVAELFFGERASLSQKSKGLGLYFFLITASHGLLDGFTNGGLGIAFFSPFENLRYFFPFRPIEVAPISIRGFFSPWGMKVVISEVTWVLLPMLALVLLTGFFQKNKKVQR